jgi:hypothetical protein
MPKPGEHKTVQTRILKYARQIGWGEKGKRGTFFTSKVFYRRSLLVRLSRVGQIKDERVRCA